MPSVQLLRDEGFEVASIQENFSGISDLRVVQMAIETQSIILTFDRDYGRILVTQNIPNPPSVIYFRFKGMAPVNAGHVLRGLLESKIYKFQDAFTVVEEKGVRQRFYR